MSKMCCEVCGGTSIKKMSDGLFECQSCGVQYSTEDIKKLFAEEPFSPADIPKPAEAIPQKEIATIQVSTNVDDDQSLVCIAEYQNIAGETERKVQSPTITEMAELIKQLKARPEDDLIEIVRCSFDGVYEKLSLLCDDDYTYVLWAYQGEDMYLVGDSLTEDEVLQCICEYADTGDVFSQEPILFNPKKDHRLPKKSRADEIIESVIHRNTEAEERMNVWAIFGLIPFTFYVGFIVLFAVKDAKAENNGMLSPRARKYLWMGMGGFVGWTFLLVILPIISAIV